jgi:lysophospholipase L1-like esterase
MSTLPTPSDGTPSDAAPAAGKWWVDVLVFAVVTALSLLAGEWAVRWTLGDGIVLFPRNHAEVRYGDYRLRRMTPDSEFWHTSKDGSWRFRTNNAGFRDDEPYRHAKPPGTFRVLVLGDSHTAGFEVHQGETYSAVLRDRLRARGLRAEVLNAGVSGLGTAEQLAFLEQEGWKYAPDVVVLGFFGNDFSDNVRSGLFRLEGGKVVEAGKEYAPAVGIIRAVNAVPGLKWASENSYLYSLAFNTVWELAKRRSASEARGEEAVRTGAVTADEQALTRALLARLAAFAHAKGAKVVLADIPEVGEGGRPRSSLPPSLRAGVAGAFDATLWSEDWLADLPAGARAHVPNGHRHIDAAAHARLARAIERTLAERLALLPRGASAETGGDKADLASPSAASGG